MSDTDSKSLENAEAKKNERLKRLHQLRLRQVKNLQRISGSFKKFI